MRKFEFPGGAKDVTGWVMAHPVYDLKKALMIYFKFIIFHMGTKCAKDEEMQMGYMFTF